MKLKRMAAQFARSKLIGQLNNAGLRPFLRTVSLFDRAIRSLNDAPFTLDYPRLTPVSILLLLASFSPNSFHVSSNVSRLQKSPYVCYPTMPPSPQYILDYFVHYASGSVDFSRQPNKHKLQREVIHSNVAHETGLYVSK